MALTINTNQAATAASRSLNSNNKHLQKSLSRLSSGKRIISPADDAGGLAVSMKLGAAISRTKAAISNIQNSLSFSEVQDGGLSSAAQVIERMAELKSLSLDVMKSASDVANYETEFDALQLQLFQIGNEQFNGVSLFATTKVATGGGMKFGTDVHSVSVYTSDAGKNGSIVSMHKSALLSAVWFEHNNKAKSIAYGTKRAVDTGGVVGTDAVALAADRTGATDNLATFGLSFFTQALENVATLRAENGAVQARLQFAEDHLRLSKANLEAANSRIMDVDVAEESTTLAKFNILAQASAAMLAQANATSSTALLLLG